MTDPAGQGPSPGLITVIAIAAGALIANLYYAQPLIAAIGPAIGVAPSFAGTVVGVTQIGYGLGLFFLVSLADLVENKLLVLVMLACALAGLIGVATAHGAAMFFAASLLIGLCSTGAQILLPFLAHLVPPARRGRVLGNVMAGVLAGIMLARPVALFLTQPLGWRAVFWCAAVLLVGIAVALMRLMPRHRPQPGLHYGRILASMAGLMRDLPDLRRRSLYQSLMFAAFNLLWTVAPLMLADRFGLDNQQIGLFALAGAGGALAAPLAGRLADRGLGTPAAMVAMAVLACAFYATGPAARAGALVWLAVLAILIDAAVQTNHITCQRIIFLVPPEIRGRANALYMTTMFIGGAAGSVLGAYAYHRGGWTAASLLGAALGAAALLACLVLERRPALRTADGTHTND